MRWEEILAVRPLWVQWDLNFPNTLIMSLPPPSPLGKAGHLDLLWFPITQMMCVGIHVCARLCLPKKRSRF